MIKKILIGLLIFFVLIGLSFVITGLMYPTYEESVSVEIDAGADKTWAIFMDTAKMGEWLEGFKSMKLIKGDGQSPGSVFSLTFDESGREFSIKETVTAYKPGELFSFDLDDDFGSYKVDISLKEENGKTTLTEHMSGEAKGIFGKAMMAIMKGMIKENKVKWYEKLGDIVEESDWQPAPPETTVLDTTVVDSSNIENIK